MKKIFLTILLTIFVLSVASACMGEDAPGYTDTPYLPFSQWRVHDQARPQPKIVKPGTGDLGVTAPDDAIVLFEGTHLDAWRRTDGQPIGNGIADGAFDIMKTGQLRTKDEFGGFQLHLEWVTPLEPEDRMNWGNSGVLLMGVFEMQIIESCDSFIYADGNAGAIYGQFPPLVNPARKPGQWQSFDIFFTPAKFEGDTMESPAFVTLVYNGVVVQNNRRILGTVAHRALPGPYPMKEKGPIVLQDHHSGVRFRNIWIREL